MTEYRVSTAAYVKLQLHACKHPSSACYGLLIGSESAGRFEIRDAVPLFHHTSPLTPLTEAACAMVDTWCQQTKQQIVGCYVANGVNAHANLGSGSSSILNFTISRLADHIETQCVRSCVLSVESTQLKSEANASVQLVLKDLKRGWLPVESKLRIGEVDSDAQKPMKLLSKALQQQAQESVVDMDDHLEDVRKDWRNPDVVALLQLNV